MRTLAATLGEAREWVRVASAIINRAMVMIVVVLVLMVVVL